MKLVALFAVPLLIAASPNHSPRPITPAEQAKIKQLADDLLFDGVSARWKWPDVRSSAVYCGEINAKNRMGAYTGWHPFYVLDDKFRIQEDGNSRVAYEGLCGAAGYIPKADWLLRSEASSPSAPASPQP